MYIAWSVSQLVGPLVGLMNVCSAPSMEKCEGNFEQVVLAPAITNERTFERQETFKYIVMIPCSSYS